MAAMDKQQQDLSEVLAVHRSGEAQGEVAPGMVHQGRRPALEVAVRVMISSPARLIQVGLGQMEFV